MDHFFGLQRGLSGKKETYKETCRIPGTGWSVGNELGRRRKPARMIHEKRAAKRLTQAGINSSTISMYFDCVIELSPMVVAVPDPLGDRFTGSPPSRFRL